VTTPDDWSGHAGPVPEVTLFGQPKHGKIVFSTGPNRWTLHLPNGTTEDHPHSSTAFGGVARSGTPAYGTGGTNYYWKKPGIGPAPTRTPDQQAYDTAHGHEWRNDRINYAWFWPDAAGDVWRVEVSLGAGGLTKTATVTLRLAGALFADPITRTRTISLSDPADIAFGANFLGQDDGAWNVQLHDVHPSGGKAIFGVMRLPMDKAEWVNSLSDTFPLFSLTEAAWEQVDVVGVGAADFIMPYMPAPVATAWLELQLSGSARADNWSVTSSVVKSRAQTRGGFTTSKTDSYQHLTAFPRMWARTVTWDAALGSHILEYTPGPVYYSGPYDPDTYAGPGGSLFLWSSPKGVAIGSLQWSMVGTDMVTAVFYDAVGAIAVVTSDVSYSLSTSRSHAISQSGSATYYSLQGLEHLAVDSRAHVDNATWEREAQANFKIKLNGVTVFELPNLRREQFTVSTTWAYNHQDNQPTQTAASYVSSCEAILGDQSVTWSRPAAMNGAEILGGTDQHLNGTSNLGIGWGANPFNFDGTFAQANLAGIIEWALRFGPKRLYSASSDEPTTTINCFSLTPVSNNLVQLRGRVAGSGGGLTHLGPVIGPSGAFAGPAPAAYSATPPLIHVSYNPFDQQIGWDIKPLNFC